MKSRKLILLVIFVLVFCLVSCKEEKPSPENPGNNTDRPVRPHSHEYGEWELITSADLFNQGEKVKKCSTCTDSITEKYYYLDEIKFTDKTYQYSGEEKKIFIEGLL